MTITTTTAGKLNMKSITLLSPGNRLACNVTCPLVQMWFCSGNNAVYVHDINLRGVLTLVTLFTEYQNSIADFRGEHKFVQQF